MIFANISSNSASLAHIQRRVTDIQVRLFDNGNPADHVTISIPVTIAIIKALVVVVVAVGLWVACNDKNTRIRKHFQKQKMSVCVSDFVQVALIIAE